MRRLLMFLVEKLPKDFSSSSAQEDSSKGGNKSKSINQLVAQKLEFMLSHFWAPHFIKCNSLRPISENVYIKEGCKNHRSFHATRLIVPNSKAKYSKGILKS